MKRELDWAGTAGGLAIVNAYVLSACDAIWQWRVKVRKMHSQKKSKRLTSHALVCTLRYRCLLPLSPKPETRTSANHWLISCRGSGEELPLRC